MSRLRELQERLTAHLRDPDKHPGPDDVEDRAARAAGFDGASRIGSYLRSLILRHNDTLGTPVR